MKKINKKQFKAACHALAEKHASIRKIRDDYGFPEQYSRPLSFETMVQFILEQQVSLASGKAAFNRLGERLRTINPENILKLNVDELRTCSVSRQKSGYLHHLSKTVADGLLVLSELPALPDEEVRAKLMQVKGIGPWTADVALMMCLQRPDVLPIGDVALVNSIRHLHQKPDWTLQEIQEYAAVYAPFRTVASFCYWHAYIQRKNIVLET